MAPSRLGNYSERWGGWGTPDRVSSAPEAEVLEAGGLKPDM